LETDRAVSAKEALVRPQAATGAVARAEQALFWTVVGTIGVMPLALGSARPWTWALGAILIGLAVFSYGLCLSFVPGFRMAVPWRRLWLPGCGIAIAAAWGVVQILPLGTSALAHPLWTAAADALPVPTSGHVSVDPYDTATGLMRLGAYGGIFFLVVQLCRDANRAYLAMKALVTFEVAYALYGILAYALTPAYILWLPRASSVGDLASTFVSSKFYAAYAGLGLITALALLAKLVQRPVLTSPTRRALFANLRRAVAQRAWAPFAASLLLATTILLSHSRAGMLSAGIGTLALLFCLFTVSRLNRIGRVTVALLVVGAMLLIVDLGAEITLNRLESSAAKAGGQLTGIRLVLEGIADSPLLGHGYGAFDPAIQIYSEEAPDRSHVGIRNAYLELAFELGLPAAAALVLSIAATSLICFFGLYRRRRDIAYPSLAAAATALVGADGLVNFSLQLPAVAMLFSFILGIGYSQSWSSSDPR